MSELRITTPIRIRLSAILIMAFAHFSAAHETPIDYQQVLKIVGKQGDYKSSGLKVNIPRNDLQVKSAGYAVPTPFGIGAGSPWRKVLVAKMLSWAISSSPKAR